MAGLLVFGIASLRAPALAQPAAGEYDVKAVFLFHFTRFVEWPPAAFAASDAPFAVCVLGDDPFDGALEEVMRGETAAGRRVVVRQPTSLGEAGGCQLLFVSGVEAAAGLGAVPGVREGLVLTVGDTPELLGEGVLIAFVLREGRVRLQVSSPALHGTRLKISSKLLRLAEQVTPAPR